MQLVLIGLLHGGSGPSKENLQGNWSSFKDILSTNAAHMVCKSLVYVMVTRLTVRMSVCPINWEQQWAAAGRFAAECRRLK